ncbi:Sigma 54 modulation protein / S30EA ribosomal protein [Nitrosospira briensis]|uniref:Sigma 54 modulation protein / S30EA ribosomal protein n=1 Tax=Nitrosospira briensis TaxID=35799 RepID=A0A1I4YRF5_9PROT|nr:HPF/RaiA family ribosome-associated protein [Nitrosospira briensis]SFN40586.1 Sigma 54 modulation protein / S30EA ribosomal protein [Nitrosospira briensis]
MQVQINSGSSVEMDSELSRRVESTVTRILDRFEAQITRVEVHLSDVNNDKSGARDKRCLMEARPAGLDPMAVTNSAANVEDAIKGAAEKLKTALENQFGRARSRT